MRTNIRALNKRLYFKCKDLQEVSGIRRASARVRLSREVKKGAVIRPKKDFYISRDKWENLLFDEYLQLSNVLQVPSYISFMTALGYYDVTTQVQRNYFESAAVKRTKTFEADGAAFRYYKLKKELYFGFENNNGIFIAVKEKAFLDMVYLYSLKRYAFDMASIDREKFDKKKLGKMAKLFPLPVRTLAKTLCGI